MIETVQAEIDKLHAKSNIELYVTMALSTSHLTEQDAEQLSFFAKDQSNSCQVMEREYGFFIKLLTAEPEDLKNGTDDIVNLNRFESMSDWFNIMMAFATANRISLIEFDRDASTNKLFEVFD
ncbi:hypothetical protein AB4138_04050 [Vibrio sp. 10N.286.52.C3]|uniref:DUF5983 family protein n=1 Tax=Vibrio sp. 10N.286.52.C3 TaxID=3229713 RepID=UPI00354FC8CD